MSKTIENNQEGRVTKKAIQSFAELVNHLNSLTYEKYQESKLPSSDDDKITEACELFKESSADERLTISAILQDKNVHEFLLEYAIRMSMQSVRANSRIDLINGLVALGMVAARLDLDHEDDMALALIYHSAVKLGNPDQFFNEAAQYVINENAKEFILHFPKRLPQDRKLESFGYHEVKGANGLIYQYANHRIPTGLL
jgi:hypothetical protein